MPPQCIGEESFSSAFLLLLLLVCLTWTCAIRFSRVHDSIPILVSIVVFSQSYTYALCTFQRIKPPHHRTELSMDTTSNQVFWYYYVWLGIKAMWLITCNIVKLMRHIDLFTNRSRHIVVVGKVVNDGKELRKKKISMKQTTTYPGVALFAH